tara:strand:- start:1036 stop:1464 length:429 start_codon:yes stop_codon:yes gene_type:complete
MQNTNDIRKFITSGKATFTVTSARTGQHFTYRVKQTEPGAHGYFVSVLTGPDNVRDYTYAGMLFDSDQGLAFRLTKGSKVSGDAPSFRGFEWLVRMVNADKGVSDHATLDHMGKCGRCGRALTHPESIATGLGPECVKKVAA